MNCQTDMWYSIITFLPVCIFILGFITPKIGKTNDGKGGTCVIESTWGLFVYIYIISGAAILLTLIFFGLFVWNLFFGVWSKENQNTLTDSTVRNQFDNAALRLQASSRVFFTLGLIWICDIASWALRWRYNNSKYKHIMSLMNLSYEINCYLYLNYNRSF